MNQSKSEKRETGLDRCRKAIERYIEAEKQLRSALAELGERAHKKG